MAQTIVTVVTDDLTGDVIKGKTVTRNVSVDGVSYTLELSEDSSHQLDADLEPWVEAGKTAAVLRKSTTRRTSDAANIRSWANANGWSLGARGRIPFGAIEAYKDRNNGAA